MRILLSFGQKGVCKYESERAVETVLTISYISQDTFYSISRKDLCNAWIALQTWGISNLVPSAEVCVVVLLYSLLCATHHIPWIYVHLFRKQNAEVKTEFSVLKLGDSISLC